MVVDVQLTLIFFGVNSLASPCVIVNNPAFRLPPIDAVVPGVIAPVPDVRVRLPPGEMMSYLETTVSRRKHQPKRPNNRDKDRRKDILFPVSALPQNLTPNNHFASSKSASAIAPRIILSTLE